MQQKLTEFQLIETFFKPLTKGEKASQNLADDAAELSLKENEKLVISKDLAVQDVHFLMRDGGFKIASKLLRSNLSDIASCGAKPLHYMLGFSKNSEAFTKDFTAGLQSVQDEFDITLIGGDTVASKHAFFSVTIFGCAQKDKTLSRTNAKNGDLIFVSGSIGDAYLGLQISNNALSFPFNAEDEAFLLNRHFFPSPRVQLGLELVKQNLSQCAIDVSDGLIADLRHICQSSQLNATLHQSHIPFSSSAQKILAHKPSLLPDLISGGDDYELLFTVDEKNYDTIMALSAALKLDLTCIGTMSKPIQNECGVTLLDNNHNNIELTKYGYEH